MFFPSSLNENGLIRRLNRASDDGNKSTGTLPVDKYANASFHFSTDHFAARTLLLLGNDVILSFFKKTWCNYFFSLSVCTIFTMYYGHLIGHNLLFFSSIHAILLYILPYFLVHSF